MQTPDYSPHIAHVARASGPAQWWRIPLVLVCFVVLSMLLALPFNAISTALLPGPTQAAYTGQPTQGAAILGLFEFVIFGLALFLAVGMFHGRGLLSAIGPLRQAWRAFRRVVAAMLILTVVTWWLPDLEPAPFRSSLSFGSWLQFLPLFLVALAIQTGAEELLFRGYLQQQLGKLSSSPWVWMVFPSVVFGLLHYPNHPGPNAWPLVGLIILSGMIYADLTARTGNLGAAWGLHFIGNFFAIGIFSMNDSSGGMALYLVNWDLAVALPPMHLILFFGAEIVYWLAARLALRV